jgi:hypothetical protein
MGGRKVLLCFPVGQVQQPDDQKKEGEKQTECGHMSSMTAESRTLLLRGEATAPQTFWELFRFDSQDLSGTGGGENQDSILPTI